MEFILPFVLFFAEGVAMLALGYFLGMWDRRLPLKVDKPPIDWLSEGPHWEVDARSPCYPHGGCRLIETETGKTVDTRYVIAANSAKSKLLALKVDESGTPITAWHGNYMNSRHALHVVDYPFPFKVDLKP